MERPVKRGRVSQVKVESTPRLLGPYLNQTMPIKVETTKKKVKKKKIKEVVNPMGLNFIKQSMPMSNMMTNTLYPLNNMMNMMHPMVYNTMPMMNSLYMEQNIKNIQQKDPGVKHKLSITQQLSYYKFDFNRLIYSLKRVKTVLNMINTIMSRISFSIQSIFRIRCFYKLENEEYELILDLNKVYKSLLFIYLVNNFKEGLSLDITTESTNPIWDNDSFIKSFDPSLVSFDEGTSASTNFKYLPVKWDDCNFVHFLLLEGHGRRVVIRDISSRIFVDNLESIKILCCYDELFLDGFMVMLSYYTLICTDECYINLITSVLPEFSTDQLTLFYNKSSQLLSYELQIIYLERFIERILPTCLTHEIESWSVVIQELIKCINPLKLGVNKRYTNYVISLLRSLKSYCNIFIQCYNTCFIIFHNCLQLILQSSDDSRILIRGEATDLAIQIWLNDQGKKNIIKSMDYDTIRILASISGIQSIKLNIWSDLLKNNSNLMDNTPTICNFIKDNLLDQILAKCQSTVINTFNHNEALFIYNILGYKYKSNPTDTTTEGPAVSSLPEVQSNSSPLAGPPEVTTSVPLAVEASSIYLSLKGDATPRDRGRGEGGMKSSTGPQVEPVADLREAEGEINKRADGRTRPQMESCLQEEDNVITSSGGEWKDTTSTRKQVKTSSLKENRNLPTDRWMNNRSSVGICVYNLYWYMNEYLRVSKNSISIDKISNVIRFTLLSYNGIYNGDYYNIGQFIVWLYSLMDSNNNSLELANIKTCILLDWIFYNHNINHSIINHMKYDINNFIYPTIILTQYNPIIKGILLPHFINHDIKSPQLIYPPMNFTFMGTSDVLNYILNNSIEFGRTILDYMINLIYNYHTNKVLITLNIIISIFLSTLIELKGIEINNLNRLQKEIKHTILGKISVISNISLNYISFKIKKNDESTSLKNDFLFNTDEYLSITSIVDKKEQICYDPLLKYIIIQTFAIITELYLNLNHIIRNNNHLLYLSDYFNKYIGNTLLTSLFSNSYSVPEDVMTKVAVEVQSNSLPLATTVGLADSSPLEVINSDPTRRGASSNYLSLKSIATPGDRGGSVGVDGIKSSTVPQVEPGSDLWELEGEVNKEAVCKTTKGGDEVRDWISSESFSNDNIYDIMELRFDSYPGDDTFIDVDDYVIDDIVVDEVSSDSSLCSVVSTVDIEDDELIVAVTSLNMNLLRDYFTDNMNIEYSDYILNFKVHEVYNNLNHLRCNFKSPQSDFTRKYKIGTAIDLIISNIVYHIIICPYNECKTHDIRINYYEWLEFFNSLSNDRIYWELLYYIVNITLLYNKLYGDNIHSLYIKIIKIKLYTTLSVFFKCLYNASKLPLDHINCKLYKIISQHINNSCLLSDESTNAINKLLPIRFCLENLINNNILWCFFKRCPTILYLLIKINPIKTLMDFLIKLEYNIFNSDDYREIWYFLTRLLFIGQNYEAVGENKSYLDDRGIFIAWQMVTRMYELSSCNNKKVLNVLNNHNNRNFLNMITVTSTNDYEDVDYLTTNVIGYNNNDHCIHSLGNRNDKTIFITYALGYHFNGFLFNNTKLHLLSKLTLVCCNQFNPTHLQVVLFPMFPIFIHSVPKYVVIMDMINSLKILKKKIKENKANDMNITEYKFQSHMIFTIILYWFYKYTHCFYNVTIKCKITNLYTREYINKYQSKHESMKFINFNFNSTSINIPTNYIQLLTIKMN